MQTAFIVQVFGRLMCKPVDVESWQLKNLISYTQKSHLRVIPSQNSLFGSPRKRFKVSQKHFGADFEVVGAVPERLRVALEPSWSHTGAILEPCWSVSSTTMGKGRFPNLCQSSVLKDVSNEITIQRSSGQIYRGGGEGACAANHARGGDHRGGASASHAFSPLSGVGGYGPYMTG